MRIFRKVLEGAGLDVIYTAAFEDTMLEVAGIKEKSAHSYFVRSENWLNSFFIELDMSIDAVKAFATSLNDKYGQGTAVYMPEFTSEYDYQDNGKTKTYKTHAVRVSIDTWMDKIQIDFVQKIAELQSSNPDFIKSYQRIAQQAREAKAAEAKHASNEIKEINLSQLTNEDRQRAKEAAGVFISRLNDSTLVEVLDADADNQLAFGPLSRSTHSGYTTRCLMQPNDRIAKGLKEPGGSGENIPAPPNSPTNFVKLLEENVATFYLALTKDEHASDESIMNAMQAKFNQWWKNEDGEKAAST